MLYIWAYLAGLLGLYLNAFWNGIEHDCNRSVLTVKNVLKVLSLWLLLIVKWSRLDTGYANGSYVAECYDLGSNTVHLSSLVEKLTDQAIFNIYGAIVNYTIVSDFYAMVNQVYIYSENWLAIKILTNMMDFKDLYLRTFFNRF